MESSFHWPVIVELGLMFMIMDISASLFKCFGAKAFGACGCDHTTGHNRLI